MPTPANELLTKMSRIRQEPKWSFTSSRVAAVGKPGGVDWEGQPPFGDGPCATPDMHRDTHARYNRDPAWSFPQSAPVRSGRPFSAPVPGPGGYQPAHERVRGQSPSWGFGRSKRGLKAEPGLGPGPGAYVSNFAAVTPKAPSWTASVRPENVYNKNPGPGAYQTNWEATKQGAKYVARWVAGKHRPDGETPPSSRAPQGRSPGPHVNLDGLGLSEGPKYSCTPRRRDRLPVGFHRLDGPRTQFGY
mmetsp:Transcript_29446/g.62690  ORF Transcript_29446/g.62690 Transcript_29446/m.62690 type:complete len:246 (-) Transcript_29446:66-803(-)